MAEDASSLHSEMSTADKIIRCRQELVTAPELWQFTLLDSSKFSRYLGERDIHGIDAAAIDNLWRIGLLRADVVLSEKEVKSPALQHIGKDDDGYQMYLDTRKAKPRARGYGGSFSTQKLRNDIRPYFHPFRYYVVYHITRVFSSHTTSIQFFISPDGYKNLAKNHVEQLDRWTSRESFRDLTDKWNMTAESAIIFEPMFYGKVFGRISWRMPETMESIARKRNTYLTTVVSLITPSDTEFLEELRADLCKNADIIDRNKLLHVLLRLTAWHGRHNIKSAIGGCMTIFSMAELIRRANEEISKKRFPEEDEMGFGQFMPGARKLIYGTDRVFDAPGGALRTFLSEIGIDFGIKVRCYIEGDTELGALKEALGEISSVLLINLRGQFAESRGKGLTFVGSLRNDIQAQIFSFIVMDADKHDYVRIAKKAAEEDLVSGSIFFATPDFEFENFSIRELCSVILTMAEENSPRDLSVDSILERVIDTKSNKEFFTLVGKEFPQLRYIKKDEAWGKALMNYAMRHPKTTQGVERQVIRAANMIIRANRISYTQTRQDYMVNPETGALIKRRDG